MTSPSSSHPAGYDDLNRYTRIIVDEALVRGIEVTVVDPGTGHLELGFGDHTVTTRESLSELTSATAFARCNDKLATREVLAAHGVPLPRGRAATFDAADEEFLAECGSIVVKPAVGEGGAAVSVGITDRDGLHLALEAAAAVSPAVVLEECSPGDDLRVVVIADEEVAAAVRRPPTVVGDGYSTVARLVTALAERRAAETDGAASIPLDATTAAVVGEAGWELDDVLPSGVSLRVRRTANVHTGGTIEDVTDELHPDLAGIALAVARALEIPVVGVDLMVPDVAGPDGVVIEANEQPGLANHEPRPTAQRFLDLLFPETRT
ncbi:MAG TPA: ATP-grasp domain-containing protein, partial [Acidimicrobiales bacterium]